MSPSVLRRSSINTETPLKYAFEAVAFAAGLGGLDSLGVSGSSFLSVLNFVEGSSSRLKTRRSASVENVPSSTIDFASVFGAQQRTASSWVSSTLLPATVRLRFFPRRSDTLALLLRLPLSIRLAASGSSGIEGGS